MIDGRLAESRWQRVHRRVEHHPRIRLVDLARHLKSSKGNRSMAIRDPRIDLHLVVLPRRLAYEGITVRTACWGHGRGRMPILSGLAHASRMVA